MTSTKQKAESGTVAVPDDFFDKEAQLLRQLAKIRENFLLRARKELPLLGALLERIGAGDSTGLSQLESFVHRIRGSAATFDFAAISESARQMEERLAVLILSTTAAGVESRNLHWLAESSGRLALEIEAATTQAQAGETGALLQDASADDE